MEIHHEKTIKNKLKSFQNLNVEQQFKEFQFCLLTPQSNAQRCWQAVEQLSSQNKLSEKKIAKILSGKTRFHNVKAKRILNSQASFKTIKPLLSNPNKKELRNLLSRQVNGYGLKEAGHFLRNIGHSNNEIAILDRHILKNLQKAKIIPDTKIKSPKHYLELEELFLKHAKSLQVQPDVLDLHYWSQENGEIFK